MNTMLQRKNILSIAIYCNVIDNFKRYQKDDMALDLKLLSVLVDKNTDEGYVTLEKPFASFNKTISNYFFKSTTLKVPYFVFSKKKIIYFKNGIMNIKTIYYKELCT